MRCRVRLFIYARHDTHVRSGRNERCLCACGAGHARGRGAQTQTPHLPPLRPLNSTDLAQNGQPAQASHTAHGKAPDRTRSIEMARRRAHTTGCRRRTHDISTRIPRSRPAVPGRRSRGRATVRTCALHPHPAAHAHGGLPSSLAQGVSFTIAIEPGRRSSSRAHMADAVGQASGGQRPTCRSHAKSGSSHGRSYGFQHEPKRSAAAANQRCSGSRQCGRCARAASDGAPGFRPHVCMPQGARRSRTAASEGTDGLERDARRSWGAR